MLLLLVDTLRRDDSGQRWPSTDFVAWAQRNEKRCLRFFERLIPFVTPMKLLDMVLRIHLDPSFLKSTSDARSVWEEKRLWIEAARWKVSRFRRTLELNR